MLFPMSTLAHHAVTWLTVFAAVLSTSASASFTNNSAQCIPGKLFQGVVLKGGVHAGKYLEAKDFSNDHECQEQCCREPQCDVAFMLGNKCYFVICDSIDSCSMKLAKQTLSPRLSYMSRWNSEGVQRTLFSEDQKPPWNPNVCPNMVPLQKVTLKGGITAGEFTDVGPVESLQQCYDVCCQKDRCNLAFLLANNCFTVYCEGNSQNMSDNTSGYGCQLEPAIDSPFKPEAAHIFNRQKPASVVSSFDSWGLEPPLSLPPPFVLQQAPAPPFYPSSFMQMPFSSLSNTRQETSPELSISHNTFGPFLNPYDPIPPPFAHLPMFDGNNLGILPQSNELKPSSEVGETGGYPNTKSRDIVLGYITIDPSKFYELDLGMTTTALPDVSEVSIPRVDTSDCKNGPILFNTTFKHNKHAGTFLKPSMPVKSIQECVKHCCLSQNASFSCRVAFMVSESCFLVDCPSYSMCQPMASTTSHLNPHMVMVRPHLPPSSTPPSVSPPINMSPPVDTLLDPSVPPAENYTQKENLPYDYVDTQAKAADKCHLKEILWNMTVEGATTTKGVKSYKGYESSAMKELGVNVASMSHCSQMCCKDSTCDAAVLQDGRCLSVTCSLSPRACLPVAVKSPSSKRTQLAFMARSDVTDSKAVSSWFYNTKDYAIMLSSGLIVLIACVSTITALLMSTKKLRRGGKPNFRRQGLRNTRDVGVALGKNREVAAPIEDDEEDKLEELLARASFTKNRGRRLG